MQAAGGVAITARELAERHDAHAGLVADQDDVAGQVVERRQQRRLFAVEGGGERRIQILQTLGRAGEFRDNETVKPPLGRWRTLQAKVKKACFIGAPQ